MKTIFTLVGGTDFDPTAVQPSQRRRGRRAAPRVAPYSGMPLQPIEPAPMAAEPALSFTAANGIIRKERYEVWRAAEAAVDYWRARMKFHSALSSAQQHDLPEGRSHPPVQEGEWGSIVDKWRMALVQQLLTPAPTAGAIAWKKAALIQEQFKYVGVKPERIERAIADDVAFLAAHPVRQSKRRSDQG
jgi:hypothetical protein